MSIFLKISIVFLLLTANVFAEEPPFPSKAITIYVPFSSGGTADQLTRLIAKQISQDINQNVNIQNNTNFVSATDYINSVKTVPNDGYHLIVGNLGTHASGTVISEQAILYDPIEDFEPIALIGKTPMYMILRPDFPANSYKEFIEYNMKNPDKKLTIAHSGYGSTSYLAAIYLASILKIDFNFVPFSGSGDAIKDIANGYIDIMIDQTTSALPFIKSGLVKSLFITSENRSVITPEIPTSKQVGIPEFDIKGWNMVFVPKGTSQNIINILNNLFVKALENKFVAAEVKLSNTVIIDETVNSYSNLKNFIKYEVKYWKEINTIINIKNDR